MPPSGEYAPNRLYYGDNLDVLRRHIADASVDLVYLDPPFNSSRDYNVLFRDQDGSRSEAQIKAFEDTWQWDQGAARAYQDVVEAGGQPSLVMQAFRSSIGETDMLAYLAMMAPRLIELHGVLKPTGTLYLHCDPNASHYLKLLLDSIFGPERFLNEIVWKRSSAHSDSKQGMRRCGKIHDVLLVYSKSADYSWNTTYTPYDAEYLESEYRHKTKDGRFYKQTDLTAAKPGGDVEYEWRVKRPAQDKSRWEADLTDEWKKPVSGWEYKGVRPYNGRYWGYSIANLRAFAKSGHLHHRSTGMPRLIQFADEMPGIALQDVWTDIPPALGDESLDYPTQKPRALLERIIRSSSNEGDVVLDPFCGCGTAIEAAEKLHRRWIGIDITHQAIAVIKKRLLDAYPEGVAYTVLGEPTSVAGAEELAHTDPYQFQWWALGQVGARRTEQKKGPDKGIDGRLFFHDGKGSTSQIILSVKAGGITRAHVHELRGVVDREKASIGVLISFEQPTRAMREEAASAGFFDSGWGSHPRLQLLTVGDLLEGKKIDYPRVSGVNQTFKQAPRATRKEKASRDLFDADES